MKKITFFAAVAAAALMSAACSSNNGANVKVDAELPTAAEVDSVSYLIGINFGSFIKGYDFGDVNFSEVKKGMMDFINAKGNQASPEFAKNFKVDPNEMNRLFNEYLTKRSNYNAEVSKVESAQFLEKNKLNDGIEVTESGLQYRIIEAGNEVKASATDTVYVNYKGTLIDGTEFDSNSGDPIALTLNRVIPGWTEGLQLVGEGGHIELFIPSELAYGERGTRGIAPNSALIFDVEVVKVGKAPVEEPKKK